MKATPVSDFYQNGLERKKKKKKTEEHTSAVCYLCFLALILNNTPQALPMTLNYFSYKLNFINIVSTSRSRDESSRKAKATINEEEN